jgi:catechol 2,3-dioxygenase-like lactoylglutathione lyase family enzyme
MQLNHLNLCTNDVAALTAFFTDHFGFTLEAMRGRNAFAVLRGQDGFALNVMAAPKDDAEGYPAAFHVGFIVPHPEMVERKQRELAGAGREPGEVQRFTRGGVATTTFYCRAPGGVLVEVLSEER